MPLGIYPAGHHLYKVVNKDTGFVHAKHTTLQKAKAQVRVINAADMSTKRGEDKSLLSRSKGIKLHGKK